MKKLYIARATIFVDLFIGCIFSYLGFQHKHDQFGYLWYLLAIVMFLTAMFAFFIFKRIER